MHYFIGAICVLIIFVIVLIADGMRRIGDDDQHRG